MVRYVSNGWRGSYNERGKTKAGLQLRRHTDGCVCADRTPTKGLPEEALKVGLCPVLGSLVWRRWKSLAVILHCTPSSVQISR